LLFVDSDSASIRVDPHLFGTKVGKQKQRSCSSLERHDSYHIIKSLTTAKELLMRYVDFVIVIVLLLGK